MFLKFKKLLVLLFLMVIPDLSYGWHLTVLNDTPEVFRLSIGRMGAFLPFAITGAVITFGSAAAVGAAFSGFIGSAAWVGAAGVGGTLAMYQLPLFIAGAAVEGGYDLRKKDAVYILPYSHARFSTKAGQCWGQLRTYHMIRDKHGKIKESGTLWLEKDRGPASMMCENFYVVITYTKEKHDFKEKNTGRIIRRKGDPIPDAYGNYRIKILRGQGAKKWIKKNKAAVEQRGKELEEKIKAA